MKQAVILSRVPAKRALKDLLSGGKTRRALRSLRMTALIGE
jgi:hypothetical protein